MIIQIEFWLDLLNYVALSKTHHLPATTYLSYPGVILAGVSTRGHPGVCLQEALPPPPVASRGSEGPPPPPRSSGQSLECTWATPTSIFVATSQSNQTCSKGLPTPSQRARWPFRTMPGHFCPGSCFLQWLCAPTQWQGEQASGGQGSPLPFPSPAPGAFVSLGLPLILSQVGIGM